jgi:hypothetical protein
LPVPELNPLVNPVLAQNMGRWAEVYFTSPPEKRDERVLELLHELEAEGSQSAIEAARRPGHQNSAASNAWSTSPAPGVQKSTVRCDACGHDNAEAQRFCGMCGAKLSAAYAEADSTFFSDGQEERFDQAESHRELPSFRSSREFESLDDKFGWTLDSEPGSRSYRFYIGTVLAIIILVLGYMAWRATQSGSLSSAPQSATTEAAATKAPDTSPAAAAPNPEPPQAASTHEAAADSGKSATPAAESSAQKDSGLQSAAAENSSDNEQPKTGLGNGSQELAMAHKYLDGTGGQGRDSSEAAKWLWKSVAKHNSDATVLLSDLYLRGDGVPKNCDQARILLDAAASKGSKDAGERLRHLPAFGCQ